MSGIIIYDDRQQRWYVTEDDPAWKLVSNLIRLGYRKIILPRESIKAGTVPDLDKDAPASLADTYLDLEAAGILDLANIGVAFLYISTLYDCCAALQNEVY